jgi:hypothetical protein
MRLTNPFRAINLLEHGIINLSTEASSAAVR